MGAWYYIKIISDLDLKLNQLKLLVEPSFKKGTPANSKTKTKTTMISTMLGKKQGNDFLYKNGYRDRK